MTCRCPMCCPKKAGRINRRSYFRSKLIVWEDGIEDDTKKRVRKLRRVREKRQWKKEMRNEVHHP